MLPATAVRVQIHTKDAVNERIRRRAEDNVARHSSAGPASIDSRIRELDREWDIERFIQANSSIVAITGIILGATVKRAWLLLPVAVLAFVFQHSIQGWCPPVPLLRRLGFRTAREIESERHALKAIRGDFDGTAGAGLYRAGAKKALYAASM